MTKLNEELNVSSEIQPLKKLRVWLVVKHTICRYYDDVGKLLLANFLWFLASLPVITLPAATIGLSRYCEQLLTFKDPSILSIFSGGFRKFLVSGYVFFALFIVFIGVAGFGVWFYFRMATGIFMVALGALSLWMFLFLLMLSSYVLPFVVHQDVGILTAVKRAALLAGAKPLVSFILVVTQGVLILSCIFVPFLVAIMIPVFCLLMQNVATLLALGDLEA